MVWVVIAKYTNRENHTHTLLWTLNTLVPGKGHRAFSSQAGVYQLISGQAAGVFADSRTHAQVHARTYTRTAEEQWSWTNHLQEKFCKQDEMSGVILRVPWEKKSNVRNHLFSISIITWERHRHKSLSHAHNFLLHEATLAFMTTNWLL